MDNTIQTAKIAANQTIEKQAIAANNLANVSTPGFKSQIRSLLNQMFSTDEPNKLILDSYQYDLSHGSIRHTEQPLDIALPENGWFVLRNDSFEDFYTRNGHFEVNEKGELTMKGFHVMGENGLGITIPMNSVPSFNSEGVLTTIIKDGNESKEITIGRLKTVDIIDHSYLYKHPNGFFKLKDDANSVCSQIVQNNKKIKILQQALEESNTNPTENVIDMINNTRQFEMQMKMIADCNDNEEKANSILNVNN